MHQPTSLDEARRRLRSGRWLALTGAGMSVDSGVPPFRGPGGLWEQLDPEVHAHVETLEAAPDRSWHLFRLLRRALVAATPHAGHAALARAEAAGRIVGVTTQNIDGLHQRAGSRAVIELHGSMERFRCHRCGRPVPAGEAARLGAAPGVPRCACGGVIRPAITLFGEALPEGVYERSQALLEEAGGLLVVGTSAEVYPAALLPLGALHAGRPVLVVGPDPGRLTGLPGALWLPARAVDLPRLLDDDPVPGEPA